MTNNTFINRISETGVDTLQIARSSVLIHVDDIEPEHIYQHPVYSLCRGLGALGFKSVHLCGATNYFDALDNVMEGNQFTQQPGILLTKQMAQSLPIADIIVDLTNNLTYGYLSKYLSTRRLCLYLSVMWGTNWVTASTTKTTSVRTNTTTKIFREGIPPIHRIASGLALQETLILVAKVNQAAPLEKTVIYNAGADKRDSSQYTTSWAFDTIENAILEVVGAGAVGVHLLESLTPMLGNACELRIFDPDEVGIENLPLQPAYTLKDIGRPKAIAIGEKLERFCNSDICIRPMVMSYQNRPRHLSRPSIRILCPDNFEVRKYANDLSIADKVPLVEAGSSPLAAQQRTYYPGLTACLSHRIRNLTKKVAREQKPTSCSANRALTLPGTNMIIGGILAVEALKVTDKNRFGLPSKGTITYDTRSAQRFGVLDFQPPCRHD